MRAPELLVMQLEDEIVGRIVHHADLLEHDFTLELEIFRTDRRPEHEVGDHVGRVVQVLVENPCLEARVLARGVRVERAAQLLERECDVAR